MSIGKGGRPVPGPHRRKQRIPCYACRPALARGGPMRFAIVNIGTIASGDLSAPLADGDTIITEGERIVTVGTASAREVDACDVVIDAGGATAIPGLIDSHVHITF